MVEWAYLKCVRAAGWLASHLWELGTAEQRSPPAVLAVPGDVHERWSRGAAMMREALGQLHTAGSGAHGNYTGVSSVNQKMWSS